MSNWSSVGARASDFKVEDWVVRFDSIFPGKVVGVHPGINLVDVEYPTGWEREEPEELIKITLFGVVPTSHSADSRGRGRHKIQHRQRRFARLLHMINIKSGNPTNHIITASRITRKGTSVFRPKLTKEAQLFLLGEALQDTEDTPMYHKIASTITNNFSSSEWELYRKVAKIPLSDREVDPASLKTYAKRKFTLKNGMSLRVVANFEVNKFQLLLNEKVIKESGRFENVSKVFQKLKKRDRYAW